MAKKNVNTKTNLDKLRQAFDESKGGSSGNIRWWRPNYGDNVVRVLPPIEEDSVFFEELARHRIDGEWFYCLKYKIDSDTGRPMKCPICEARTRLFRTGDKDTIKIAKEIKAKKQFVMNIVDRGSDEAAAVYVYAGGIKIWNKMVTSMLDDDIDITDVEDGYDFLVKKEEGAKTEFGQFPSYDNSKAKRKSSPLDEDPKVIKDILANRNDLKAIATFDEVEVLQNAIDSYIKSLTDDSASEEFYEDEKEDSNPKPSSKAKTDVSDFKKKLAAQLRSDGEESDED